MKRYILGRYSVHPTANSITRIRVPAEKMGRHSILILNKEIKTLSLSPNHLAIGVLFMRWHSPEHIMKTSAFSNEDIQVFTEKIIFQ